MKRSHRQTALYALAILLLVAIPAAVLVNKANIWAECRRAGHSLGYCHALVSR